MNHHDTERGWGALMAPVAVALVLFGLLGSAVYSRSIYYDEAITLGQLSGYSFPRPQTDAVPVAPLQHRLAENRNPLVMTRQLLLGDNHPPLYYLSLWVWRHITGGGIEAARWLSLICVVILGILMLRFAGFLKRPVLAVLLYSVCGITVMFGSMARDYGMAAMLLMVAFVAAIGKQTTRNALIAGCAAGLAMATHYFTFTGAVVVWAVYALRYWRGRDRAMLIPVCLIGLAAVAVAPFPLRRAISRPEFLAGFHGWGAEAHGLFDAYWRAIAPETFAMGGWPGQLAILLMSAALVAGLAASVRRRREGLAVLLPALVFLAHTGGLYLLAVVGDRTFFSDQSARYAALALPAAITLVAMGLEQLPRPAGVGLIVVLLGFQLTQVRFGADLRGATARQVASSLAPGADVVVGAGYGRGIPLSVLYELPPDANICILFDENSCRLVHENAVVVQPREDITRDAEAAFLARCQNCRAVTVENWNFP